MSNEEFVNSLLGTVIDTAKVKDKTKKPLYLDKARVSKLLAGKDDVPSAIRASLAIYGIERKITEAFELFLEDTIDCNNLDNIITELMSLNFDKTALVSSKENPKTFLIKTFIEALKAPNLILTNKCLSFGKKVKTA